MITTVTTYGLGGFDPKAPNGNVVDVREVEVDVPTPDPRDERLAALEADVQAIRDRVVAVETDRRP